MQLWNVNVGLYLLNYKVATAYFWYRRVSKETINNADDAFPPRWALF